MENVEMGSVHSWRVAQNYLSVSHERSGFSCSDFLLRTLDLRIRTYRIGEYIVSASQDIGVIVGEGTHCFVIGDIYGFESESDVLDSIDDPRSVRRFDGFFTLVHVSGRGVRVITDQACLFPMFYSAELCGLSTHVYDIASFVKATPDVEYVSFYAEIMHDLPGRTIYEGVRSVEHEMVFDLRDGRTESDSYQDASDFIDNGFPVESIATDLLDIMASGYEYLRSTRHCNRVVCDLSGGTDSRVTALMAYRVFGDIHVNTGIKLSDPRRSQEKEGEIARRIRTEFLGNAHLIEKDPSGKMSGDEVYDVLIGGLAGELFKDFFIKRVFPWRKLYANGLSKINLRFIVKTKLLANDSHVARIVAHISENISNSIRADKIVDQVYLRYFVHGGRDRYCWSPVQGRFRMRWTPFLSNQFIGYCRRIDPKHRRYHDIHSHMVKALSERCAGVEVNMSVFGAYPFNTLPVTRGSAFYRRLCLLAYDADRMSRKLVKLVPTAARAGKPTVGPPRDGAREAPPAADSFLLDRYPAFRSIRSPSIVRFLHTAFRYLDPLS